MKQSLSSYRSFTSSAFLFPSVGVWNTSEVLATTDTKNYTVFYRNIFFRKFVLCGIFMGYIISLHRSEGLQHYWLVLDFWYRVIFIPFQLANVQEFFHDINYPLGWEQYKVAAQMNENLDPPGVKVSRMFCGRAAVLNNPNNPGCFQVHCIYGTGIETPEQFSWAKGYFPDYPPSIVFGDGDGTVNRRSAEVCLRWNESNNRGKRVNFVVKSVKIVGSIKRMAPFSRWPHMKSEEQNIWP